MAKTNKGFTLIELLIVIAVIGILASAVLIGLGPVQRQGRDARRASDLRQIQNALELYSNRNGCYPTQSACSGGVGTMQWSVLQTALTGGMNPVVTVLPNDPRAGQTYFYANAQNGTGYVLGARLEDAQSPLYSNDVDGNIFNLDCGPASNEQGQANALYCVQL